MSDLHDAAAKVIELYDEPRSVGEWSLAIEALRTALEEPEPKGKK